VTALLDGQEAVALGQPDRGLSQPSADPRPRRDRVDAQPAGAVAGYLVPDDPQHGELPLREPRRESGRHRARAGQPAAPLDGYGSLRSPLEALGREQGHAAERDADGHHGLSNRAPAVVQQLGEALRLSIGHSLGGVRLPDPA
jgi:hypothetical protein